MEDNKKTRGLGRGLSELLGEARAKAALANKQSARNDISSDTDDPLTSNLLKSSVPSMDDSVLKELSNELDDLSQTPTLPVVEDQDIKATHELKQKPLPKMSIQHNNNMEVSQSLDDDEFETITPYENIQDADAQQSIDEEEQFDEIPTFENNMSADFLENDRHEAPFQESTLLSLDEDEIQKSIDNITGEQLSDLEKVSIPEVLEKVVQQEEVISNHSLAIQETFERPVPNRTGVHKLPVELISPNPDQPRRNFDINSLNELASSIKVYGIIQPILVNQNSQEYFIVAGERRWRAAQLAGLKEVPVIIVDYEETELLEVALIENIQRANLTPLEEAKAYYQLIHKHELTQNELAQKLGKSRSYIANMVRLLELDSDVKKYLESGELSIGHARVLIGIKNAAELAEKIVKSNLSVRKVEELVSQVGEKRNALLPRSLKNGKDSDVLALEADLKAALGVNVVITPVSSQMGNLVIKYHSLEQLDEICKRLCSHSEVDVA